MNGAYDLEGVIWHQHSNKLMVEILKLFPKDVPVIDIGCGHNFYISVLKYAGYVNAWGLDLVDLGSRHFFLQDVTQDFSKMNIPIWRPSNSFGKSNVISLECGEHLPSQFSNQYLDNVTMFKGDVLLSWAVPGQAGHGHVNCQSNSWVIEEMRKRGYAIDFQKTHDLRQAVSGCHCSWLINTLMYFKPAL